jgi:hypothetical protein
MTLDDRDSPGHRAAQRLLTLSTGQRRIAPKQTTGRANAG